MSVIISDEILEQGASESIVHAVDFFPWLRKDSGGNAAATLTGTPTITETSSVLTLAEKAVTSSAVIKRHNLQEIKAAHGVQFRASGGVAGTKYTIKVLVSDTDSNTWEWYGYLQVTGP